MHKYALIAILSLACISSCIEKEPPMEESGVPVFSISGMANGIPVQLSAGVNNYYMSTGFTKESYDLHVFKGALKPNGCATCGPALNIYVRNYTTRFPYSIDSAITIGHYPYFDQRNPIESHYQLSCYSNAVGTGTPAISWDFGNNRFSTETNPVVIFPVAGIYPITCTAVFPGGCFSELNQPVYLTPSRVGKTTNFTINYPDTLSLLFNSIPVNPNAIVSWDFGDGNIAQGSIVQHTYTTGGMYKVCMEYITGSDTMQLCKNVNTLDISKCKTNFSFTSELITDSLHLSHVVVEWIDTNGVLYSSGNLTQSSASNFEVTGVGEYQVNELGQRTRKLTILLNCSVSNGVQTIELKNITGTFAIAYP
ncbi:MAG: PKD domain-containing protein [Bacteroidota bacterium]